MLRIGKMAARCTFKGSIKSKKSLFNLNFIGVDGDFSVSFKN